MTLTALAPQLPTIATPTQLPSQVPTVPGPTGVPSVAPPASSGLFSGVLSKMLLGAGVGAAASFILPGGAIIGGLMGALGGAGLQIFNNFRKIRAGESVGQAQTGALGLPGQVGQLDPSKVPTATGFPTQTTPVQGPGQFPGQVPPQSASALVVPKIIMVPPGGQPVQQLPPTTAPPVVLDPNTGIPKQIGQVGQTAPPPTVLGNAPAPQIAPPGLGGAVQQAKQGCGCS